MKKHLKYLILLTLGLMITTGLVYAQTVPLGQTVQPVPFESNPGAYTDQDTASVSPTLVYDGNLLSSALITLGKDPAFPNPAVSTAYFELHTFRTPVTPQFTPGWVEIKMKYETAGTTDDTYKIEYSTDGTNWADLQPEVSAADSAFSAAIRPWSQKSDPTDVTWTWSDIGNLRVRVYCTKQGPAFPGPSWDGAQMVIHEIWATVYPLPLPPASPTSVSVQPPAVMGVAPWDAMMASTYPNEGYCFVELYVNDVVDMLTYEMTLEFDTAVLTPVSAFSYYPWTVKSDEKLDDVGGIVYMAYSMPLPVPIGEGFSGSSPFARIYFRVDIYGGGGGSAYGGEGGTTDLAFIEGFPYSFLGDTEGKEILSDFYNGWFSGPQYMSYQGSTLPDPSKPENTEWHEVYPDYCDYWTLTKWEDDPDNPDGVLSASDQIEMENETEWTYFFHVDDVTVTIHWTFKIDGEPTGELAAAEPYLPVDVPLGDPIGTYWHQIYGPPLPGSPEGTSGYCRWFAISSWEDTNGNEQFDPSDQFDFSYFDEGVTYWAHLDDVTTDIVVSQKPKEPEPPPIPEFPLGLGLMIAIAPAIPIVYLWRTRKKER